MILSDQHQMIRDALREFSQQQLAPQAAAWDRERRFPREALTQLAQLGTFGVAVPEALGGAGLDYLALAIVIEEIAAGDGGTSTIISVNNCPVCSIGMAFANDAQKERWLKPLASGQMLGAFALSWSADIQARDFQDLLMFLQAPPSAAWREPDLALMLTQAHLLRLQARAERDAAAAA
jgi:alkylation response protein AidB-like acyl-CoA dehydrogenase